VSGFPVDDGDRLVKRLVDACEAVGDEGREAFLTRLVLLLSAEIGDADRVLAAVEAALRSPRSDNRSSGTPGPPP
jgi:hypothetical protein